MKTVDLGLISYADGYLRQRQQVDAVIRGEEEVLLLCQHAPVITSGRAKGEGNVLASPQQLAERGIEQVDVERGGSVVLHCPGQVVAYPILRLKHRDINVKDYMRLLEEAMIKTLGDFGMRGERNKGYTGCWVGGKKIGFAGVAIKNWVSYHGLALNVSPDLELFSLLVSCGIRGVEVTSMERELGERPEIGEVSDSLGRRLGELLEGSAL